MKATVHSSQVCSTTLIGEDTDLLILLLYYAKAENELIYFRSDTKQSKESKVYNINQLKQVLGYLCRKLLFVHAYTGCDSTSRIYGVGKKSVFNRLVKGEEVIKSCASAFTYPNKNGNDISELGKDMMVDIFGGKSKDTLSSLRHSMFIRKVVSAISFVTPERLPPTSSTTNFHSRRVYHQIMV